MKHGILGFALCLVGLGALGLAVRGQTATPVNVVIIAVTDFDDNNWSNPFLADSITAAAEHVSTFAKETLHAKVTLLATKGETTSSRLLTLARQELGEMASDAVTLVFVLSHGTVALPAFAGDQADVIIAASDTPYREDGRQIPKDKALFLRHDLINGVLSAHRGAVFFFVDACYSGSAESWKTVTDAFQAQAGGGVSLMCLAAATPKAKAFRADFTEALVQVWKNSTAQDCHQPYQVPDLLHGVMLQSDKDLGPSDGHPTVVVPFFGDVCLESFNTNQSVAFFYNVGREDLSLSIERADRSGVVRQPNVVSERLTAIPLQRLKYRLRVFAGNQQRNEDLDLDLTQSAARVVIVGGAAGVASVARAYEMAAAIAPTQLDEMTATRLRVAAYAAYVASGDTDAAARTMATAPDLLAALKASPVAAVANRRATTPEILSSARDAGMATMGGPPVSPRMPAPPPPVQPRLSQDPRLISPWAIGALDLQSLGDFSKAGAVWLNAAKQDASGQRKALAFQAYVAFGAAKDVSTAAAVRRQFALGTADVCPGCKAAEDTAIKGSRASAESFRALTLQEVLRAYVGQ